MAIIFRIQINFRMNLEFKMNLDSEVIKFKVLQKKYTNI